VPALVTSPGHAERGCCVSVQISQDMPDAAEDRSGRESGSSFKICYTGQTGPRCGDRPTVEGGYDRGGSLVRSSGRQGSGGRRSEMEAVLSCRLPATPTTSATWPSCAPLGEEACVAAWEQGRALSLEQATKYALEHGETSAGDDVPGGPV